VLASGARVDLVFSDVNLAEATNGHALADWLASNHPQIPVLLTSADRDELCRAKVGARRATLSKPYDLAIVAERIREMVLR
jgi:CheY-like chemotaxis protein